MLGPLRPLPLVAILLIAGCKKEPDVHGTVTVEGAVLENGFITFFPVEEASATVGAAIVQGEYRVKGLAPGKKRVHISITPQAQTLAASKDGRTQVKYEAILPAALKGNDQVVAIAPGGEQLDFNLTKVR